MTTQPVSADTGAEIPYDSPEHRSPFWQWAGIHAKKLADGVVELKDRASGERSELPVAEAVDRIVAVCS